MIIRLESKTISSSVLESGRNIVRAFFSEAEISVVTLEGTNTIIEVEYSSELEGLKLWARWYSPIEELKEKETILLSPLECREILGHNTIGREEPLSFLLKHIIYKLLFKVTGKSLPWGILTGIRPTKLVHKMNDLMMDEGRQRETLLKRYSLREDRAELLLNIAKVQEPFLKQMESHPKRVSIYIGIPFCPSRCSYCSFPGFALSRTGRELEEYLKVLTEEIATVGELMSSVGYVADTIYLGGGTPTILNEYQLDQLLEKVHSYLPIAPIPEITVEGGRPETLSSEKLWAMHQRKVNRLSINPQTMNNETLKKVGRSHTVDDIYNSFNLARSIGEWTINMDLILGLPEEGVTEIKKTLEQLESLNPDNLTVHVLALKRGSRVKSENYSHTFPSIIEQMQQITYEIANSWGLRPYYLYRQKQIAGNLENIGYALPGKECRYNIAIMEERQSVLGIGAGASTKVVNVKDYSLENFFHPVDWRTYTNRWGEVHKKRSELLRGLSVINA